jgi:hypothetical protein
MAAKQHLPEGNIGTRKVNATMVVSPMIPKVPVVGSSRHHIRMTSIVHGKM